MIQEQNDVAVVFAGGGVTGYFFEAGCLKALRLCGVPIDAYSGVSAGAVVAALAAHGEDPEQHDPFEKVKIRYFLKGLLHLKSLLHHSLVGRLSNALGLHFKSAPSGSLREELWGIPNRTIWDLAPLETYLRQSFAKTRPKPLFITATNIDSGKIQVFTSDDDIPKAVRASCSVPGITVPPLIDGCYYVDGIVTCCANMNPVSDSRLIICVNPITFNEQPDGMTVEKGLMRMLDQSFRLVNYNRLNDDISRLRAQGKKIILIEPKGCPVMARNPMQKDIKAHAIQSGHDYTIAALKEHVDWFDQLGISIVLPDIEGDES